MNAGVSSKKENVKESQSQSVTPSLDTSSGARLGASQMITPPYYVRGEVLFRDYFN